MSAINQKHPVKSYLILIISGIIALFSASTQAEELSNHDRLTQAIEKYLIALIDPAFDSEQIHVAVSPIDKRIKIPDCSGGYHLHAEEESLSQPYISVRASCPATNWYLFASTRVSRTRSIVVTSGILSPGTVLSAQNLTLADVDVKRLRHTAYTSMDTLIGARIKHRVREGQPVQANMLCFVCKGDRVTIKAQLTGMQVKTSGIASQDGVIGDAIQVMNTNSKKTIIAQVASAQEVIVNL